MANRLDPTWAHLPAPAPTHAAHAAASHYYSSSSAWLNPAAAFENEALTSALRASMSPAAASSYPATPSSSSTSSASELLSGGHDAPAPATRPGPAALARPKAGRVSKRKPRPSRRAPTTYISADPANFRRMVQEITGLPVPCGPSSSSGAAAPETASAAPSWTAPPACVLPTLDTSAFLLDRTMTVQPGADDKSAGRGATYAAAAEGEDDESSVLLELEAMVCAPAAGVAGFPTLESWGII